MSFTALPPDGTIQTADTNWRNFSQSRASGYFNPTPTVTGHTNPPITGTGATTFGYYKVSSEGVCFYHIYITPTTGTLSITWTAAQSFILPFPVFNLGSASAALPYWGYHVTTAFSPATGGTLTNLTLLNQAFSGRTYGTLVPVAVGPITPSNIVIQGWYFVGK